MQLDEQSPAFAPELLNSPVLVAWESAKRCWHQTQGGDAMLPLWKDWYNPEYRYEHLCTSLGACCWNVLSTLKKTMIRNY